MSRTLSRTEAIEDISNWSTNDVQSLLRKNGLEECCAALAKRQIDGDELLHLTEGKLALWKSDLPRSLVWSLWSFVEKIRNNPEKYVEEKMVEARASEDRLSDTGSWGTDFEDEAHEAGLSEKIRSNEPVERETELRFQFQSGEISKPEIEGSYANCASLKDEDTFYANCGEEETLSSFARAKRSLAEQLQEQLKLRNAKDLESVEDSPAKRIQINLGEERPTLCQPQKSFLYNTSKAKPCQAQKRMNVPPPPEPKREKDNSSKDRKKHSTTIKNLDLVANLPTRTNESDDEYEVFDEKIIVENRKKSITKAAAEGSLIDAHRIEVDGEDEQSEIYESITETPDDDGRYPSPVEKAPTPEAPPPLPAKPTQSSSSSSLSSSSSSSSSSATPILSTNPINRTILETSKGW